MKKTIDRMEVTKELNNRFWTYTKKIGIFRCPEVTIREERVDFLTYENRTGFWRCYEVKSCKEDFFSEAKWTFIGHYNYFVMKENLYHQLKEYIPDHVGVINGYRSLKRAKKRDLKVNEDYLLRCFMRSLYTQYMDALESVN